MHGLGTLRFGYRGSLVAGELESIEAHNVVTEAFFHELGSLKHRLGVPAPEHRGVEHVGDDDDHVTRLRGVALVLTELRVSRATVEHEVTCQPQYRIRCGCTK